MIQAKNRVFDTFANKLDADQHILPQGTPAPPTIKYGGKTFFSPELLRKVRGGVETTKKGTIEGAKTRITSEETLHSPDKALAAQYGIDGKSEPYGIYDPSAARSFGKQSPQLRPELKEGSGDVMLGPKAITDTLNGLDAHDPYHMDPLARFYREQITGIGFPVHIANILRRVGDLAGGNLGRLNPKAYAAMYRTLMDPELQARAQNPLDPAASALREQGSYPNAAGNMQAFHQYWGGNWNLANWLQKPGRFGRKVLFDPNFLGLGGIDQKARIQAYDMLQDRYPGKSNRQIAAAVDDTLAQYNQINWSDLKRQLAPYLVFPGWDTSSMRYVMQHPFKTTLPSALLVLLANQASYRLGQLGKTAPDDVNHPITSGLKSAARYAGSATKSDTYDPISIHAAKRSGGLGLVNEPLGRAAMRPVSNAVSAAAQGENLAGVESATARGLQGSVRQVAGMLHPAIGTLTQLGLGAKDLFGGSIANREDRATGEALPNFLKAAAGHSAPLLSRFADEEGNLDWLSGVGGSFGVPNYASGPDITLKRELSRASGVRQALDDFTKTDPAQAKTFKADRVNGLYLRFYPALRDTVKNLDQIDDAITKARNTKGGDELTAKLKFLQARRDHILVQATKLTGRLFDKKSGGSAPPAPVPPPNSFLSQPSM